MDKSVEKDFISLLIERLIMELHSLETQQSLDIAAILLAVNTPPEAFLTEKEKARNQERANQLFQEIRPFFCEYLAQNGSPCLFPGAEEALKKAREMFLLSRSSVSRYVLANIMRASWDYATETLEERSLKFTTLFHFAKAANEAKTDWGYQFSLAECSREIRYIFNGHAEPAIQEALIGAKELQGRAIARYAALIILNKEQRLGYASMEMPELISLSDSEIEKACELIPAKTVALELMRYYRYAIQRGGINTRAFIERHALALGRD